MAEPKNRERVEGEELSPLTQEQREKIGTLESSIKPTIAERMNDTLQRIRVRVSMMHRDDGGYDKTAEDIRKLLIEFDRGG